MARDEPFSWEKPANLTPTLGPLVRCSDRTPKWQFFRHFEPTRTVELVVRTFMVVDCERHNCNTKTVFLEHHHEVRLGNPGFGQMVKSIVTIVYVEVLSEIAASL